MKEKKILLFDLDGTLTDPAIGITNAVQKALSYFRLPEEPRENLYKFIGPPLVDAFMEFYGFSHADAETALKVYRSYYREIGLFENHVYEGIPEMLYALRSAGKTLAVATSKPEEFSVRILEKFGLAQYFHYICGASFDESRAQKEQVIAYALQKCGVQNRGEVVMIGDRKHDILGAKINCLDSIGVLYGYGNRTELETAGADAIAESVCSLQNLLL